MGPVITPAEIYARFERAGRVVERKIADAATFPALAPDGSIVASVVNDGKVDLAAFAADGGRRLVTNDSALDIQASVAGHGTIAFLRAEQAAVGIRSEGAKEGSGFEIHTINGDGTGLRRLTRNKTAEAHPAWSPDGKRIAYASDEDGDFEIHVMNADGTGVTRLTRNDAGDTFPTWSPDGRYITYASDEGGDFEIHVMNADGTGVTRLTDNGADDISPSWSKRGITFSSKRGDDYDLVLIGGQDQKAKPLTAEEHDEVFAVSSPDGSRTVFTRLPRS